MKKRKRKPKGKGRVGGAVVEIWTADGILSVDGGPSLVESIGAVPSWALTEPRQAKRSHGDSHDGNPDQRAPVNRP